MKIPNKVKIGAFEWKVAKNKNLMHERHERAVTRPKRLLIEIDPGAEEIAQEESLIHEILEAISWQYNIEFVSHKDLSVLATVLHQVIKDNPDTFKEWDIEDIRISDHAKSDAEIAKAYIKALKHKCLTYKGG